MMRKTGCLTTGPTSAQLLLFPLGLAGTNIGSFLVDAAVA